MSVGFRSTGTTYYSQLGFFMDDLTAEGAESAEKEKREMNN
jgi:hypothetical protein